MDLIATMVLVPHGQLLQIARDVISVTGIKIPVRVDAIRRSCRCGRRLGIRWPLVRGIKALVAAQNYVALLATQLTDRALRRI